MLSKSLEVLDDSGQQSKRLVQAMRLDWLGQTIASVCWISSVFAYGISSVGDGLQLTAALAWLIANLASLFTNSE